MLFELVGMSVFFFYAYMTHYGLWQAFFWDTFVVSIHLLGGSLFMAAGVFTLIHLDGVCRDEFRNRHIPRQANLVKMVIEKPSSELDLLTKKYNGLVIGSELLQRQMSEKHKIEVMELESKLTKTLVAIEKLESMIRERDVAAQKAAADIKSCKVSIEKKDVKMADQHKNSIREHDLAVRKAAEELESYKLTIEQKDVEYENAIKERNLAIQRAAANTKDHKLAIGRKDVEIADLRKHELTISKLNLVVEKAAKEIESYKLIIEQKDLETSEMRKQYENALTVQASNIYAFMTLQNLPENLKKTIDEMVSQRLQQQHDELVNTNKERVKQLKEKIAKLNDVVAAKAAVVPVGKENVVEEADTVSKVLELEATIELMEEQRDGLLDQIDELKGALLKARPMAVPKSRSQKP